MKVDSINNTKFNGKINFDKKMPKALINYTNEVFDFSINGLSPRKMIAARSYDIGIYKYGSKKTIHPKIAIITSFKADGEDLFYQCKINIKDSAEYNANIITKFLNTIDRIKESKKGYNNYYERIAIAWKNIFAKQ